MSKVKPQIWALVHDNVGYQIYTKAVNKKRDDKQFYYDPHGKRWLKENIGEILAEYTDENKALNVKGEIEDYEILHRLPMLDAFEEYNYQKNKLEDAIREIVQDYV